MKSTVETGSIVKGKDQDKDGFYYSESLEWEENGVVMGLYHEWRIFPDGTFAYDRVSDEERNFISGSGTFDSHKYESYVNLMKYKQIDWTDELQFDDDKWDLQIG